jgi:hypothetical protein
MKHFHFLHIQIKIIGTSAITIISEEIWGLNTSTIHLQSHFKSKIIYTTTTNTATTTPTATTTTTTICSLEKYAIGEHGV